MYQSIAKHALNKSTIDKFGLWACVFVWILVCMCVCLVLIWPWISIVWLVAREFKLKKIESHLVGLLPIHVGHIMICLFVCVFLSLFSFVLHWLFDFFKSADIWFVCVCVYTRKCVSACRIL